MIADFFFYNDSFGGNSLIPADDFTLWEKRAQKELLFLTNGKMSNSQEVKLCICEIAELLFKNNIQDGILSENNDGYSVSYEKRNIKNKILHTAKCYLTGTGLLYRGVFDE